MKKIGLIVIICLGIIVVPVSGFLIIRKSQNTTNKTQKIAELKITPTTAPLKVWDDQAGFTFSYIDDVTINKHDEDNENYAHIEMINPSHAGSIIIWASDTTSFGLNTFIKSDKEFKNANILDTTLGGKSAKKVIINGSTPKIVIATIIDGIVYKVETIPTDNYWNKMLGTISDSFTFKEDNFVQPNSIGNDNSVVDEEEIVE
jgi:hypothetical protein